MGSGGDVLSCHYATSYIIYGIGATLCIFDSLDSVVVVETMSRLGEVGGCVVNA